MVAPPLLRIVFFGTPRFAVPTLDALLKSRHEVVAVVTQPDRARGRGQHLSDSPVKTRAAGAGLPVFQPERLRDSAFLEALTSCSPDLGVVAAYGRILPDSLLTLPRRGMINVHASLLPRYRGAAPIHRAVMAGETETGVTIMRVVKELDAGPMLAVVRRPIGPDATSEDVEADLASAGAALLVETVDRLAEGNVREQPQDHASATYAPRITREDGAISWTDTAVQIHNRVRGLYPWPHAYTHLEGRRLIVLRTRVDTAAPAEPASAPGTILSLSGDAIIVQTGGGRLAITGLQPEGKRAMSAREFLAGRALRAGARLTTA